MQIILNHHNDHDLQAISEIIHTIQVLRNEYLYITCMEELSPTAKGIMQDYIQHRVSSLRSDLASFGVSLGPKTTKELLQNTITP